MKCDYSPILGKTIRYSVPHCGQLTVPPLLPFCFSSSHRCKQAWWIHFVQPLQRHGLTHSAARSSFSVAKHTQQCLSLERIGMTVNLWSPFSEYKPKTWTHFSGGSSTQAIMCQVIYGVSSSTMSEPELAQSTRPVKGDYCTLIPVEHKANLICIIIL